ncbi:hypothetical protein CCH79_00009113 [Gambusia affinis]|uniref:methenyltetrahydrofolate cyclohydrolase n=1 Tax=Gambusia affinis TaxID=33528 RepID=A0A315UWK9_GAMAF|nr:hypothetical protein CCH79_00009113 [Gambusia affinis]
MGPAAESTQSSARHNQKEHLVSFIQIAYIKPEIQNEHQNIFDHISDPFIEILSLWQHDSLSQVPAAQRRLGMFEQLILLKMHVSMYLFPGKVHKFIIACGEVLNFRISLLFHSGSPSDPKGQETVLYQARRSEMATIRTLRKLCQHVQHQVCSLHTSPSRAEAVVISGRKLARQIREETRADVDQWVSAGNRRPHLSVILVGDNPASHSYVLNKTRAAADVGISSETILKHSEISEEELLDLIYKLNTDPGVDGLLVQLPLPEHIDERTICNAVAPNKDVDGFHVVNVGRMCLDQSTMLPATPWGVWEIIKRTGIPTFGKNVVVAGRSKNVGMPIAMLLHTDGQHERPGGIPNLITADMIKEGAAVIDVGINRVQDPVTGKSRLVGDVDFEAVKKKAGFVTPVPGGVGPMTVAMLMKNTVKAAKSVLQFPPERIRVAATS